MPLWVVPWHLSCSTLRRKIRQSFFPGKFCLFSNTCVLNNLLFVTEFILKNSIVIVKITVAPLQIVPWGSAHSILPTRRPKFFVNGKIDFFEMFVSNEYLCPKKKTYNLHNKCQNTFWTPIKSFLLFIMSDTKRKTGQIFFLRKDCLFSKNCVFNNFLVLKIWSYYFLSNCQKNLEDSYKLFLEVCHARYYQEKWAKNICHRENS